MKKLVLLGFGLLVAALGAAAVAASQIGRGESPPFDRLSAVGVPHAWESLPADERATLEGAGVAGEVRRLAERGGVRFYTGRGSNGETCFATGVAQGPAPHFGVLFCPAGTSGEAAFPSQNVPILDLSIESRGANMEIVSVDRLAGFAADGVASVGVRDANGRLHLTRVHGNVYFSNRLAAVRPTELVALDDAGRVVYSRAF